MKNFGLLGYPLGHSFSKTYFTEKFEKMGLEGYAYHNYALSRIDELDTVLSDPHLCGFNVTIPYKQAIFRFLDEISPEAREIGAVNVVKVGRDGKLSGYNTDYLGFQQSLLPLLDASPVERGRGNPALVLGSGGGSKAVVFALEELGIPCKVVSRHPNASQISYSDLPLYVPHCPLVVQTTPVGMYPHGEEVLDFPFEDLSENCIVFDLIYNPSPTLFLEKAARQGCRVKNGLEMLHLQAEAAFRIWESQQG